MSFHMLSDFCLRRLMNYGSQGTAGDSLLLYYYQTLGLQCNVFKPGLV